MKIQNFHFSFLVKWSSFPFLFLASQPIFIFPVVVMGMARKEGKNSVNQMSIIPGDVTDVSSRKLGLGMIQGKEKVLLAPTSLKSQSDTRR